MVWLRFVFVTQIATLLNCTGNFILEEVKICPTSFRETCQWLKFPLNGLPAESRVIAAVGLLPLACGPACLGMAFPPFLVKQLWQRNLDY